MELEKSQIPLCTIHSKTKTRATIEFYPTHFKYKAMGDQLPRTIYYKAIDKITRTKHRKFFIVYVIFILALTLANIMMYQETTIWNILTNVCLIGMIIASYIESKSILKVKHGPLESDIFISSKEEELTTVKETLKRYQADCAIG